MRRSINIKTGVGFQRMLATLDTDAVTLQYPLPSASRVIARHEEGVTAYAWTLVDDAAIQHVAEMGVDGINSNRVDRLVLHLGLQPR